MTHALLGPAGEPIVVRFKRSALARRISLRVDHADGAVVVVLPPRRSEAAGMEFLRASIGWVMAQRAKLPPKISFAPGARVPLLGRELIVLHRPEARAGVWEEEGAIHVSGAAEHLPRRLTDWLKKKAGTEIRLQVARFAAQIGRPAGKVSLRDTRSRWGSCTTRGDLSFNWRLIMAPPAVLEYVVAHEVAHLVEMNHSPAFWRVVAQMVPDHAPQRAWLKRHGQSLHRFG